MKWFFALAAIAVVAVTSSPIEKSTYLPWQVGKVYHYDVFSHTFTGFEDSLQYGSAFKAQFIVNVKAPDRLEARLNKALYAPFKAHVLHKFETPSDLQYTPVMNLDEPFEIIFQESHVSGIMVPSKFSVVNINFIKGLISALQVDISPFALDHNYPNSFDVKNHQGLLKKMETDVTGQCETFYSVLPAADEWRRELPNFSSEDDPVEIIKSKNYDNCHKNVTYYVGIPDSDEKHLTQHTYAARFLVGKRGPIYKAEVTSTVVANHYARHGQQKGEVFSYIKFLLNSVEDINDKSFEISGEYNSLFTSNNNSYTFINSLLYKHDVLYIFKTDIQALARSQTLLEDLALLLENPNNMQKGSFLTNFVILTESLSNFNSEQLAHIYSSIESGKTSKNTAKSSMWTIYRDAVALVGTPAAYEQIKTWILNKKIKGEEAAEVISSMAVSFNNPSIKLLKDFFKFATTAPVMDLKFVNTSALLASSQSWARYGKDDQFVDKSVIPYLDQKLKLAIENGDTHKAQIYVIALGNLAHPNILKVFAPYLNGHITVTKYLRTQMVISLKALAIQRNDYVRDVLYAIAKNTAELYEVRVAAVQLLFLTFPKLEMMEMLALMTLYDRNTHVRAVITNAIKSAASLKGPLYAELAYTAQSVMHLITKEKFGSIYSTVDFDSEFTSENGVNYIGLLSIGSKNSFLPKYAKSVAMLKGSLFSDNSEITLSVSDVQDLLDSILQAFYEPNAVDPKFKFSAEQIIKMLNIKRDLQEPLEGALFMENSNQQDVVTFNKRDLNKFVSDTIESIPNLLKGIGGQYSKITILKKKIIMFPLITGLPYLYEYREPAIIKAEAHAVVNVDQKSKFMKGSMETTIDLTYAHEVQSTVSFQDIFGDQLYDATGVISSIQLRLPLKIDVDFSTENIKIKLEQLHMDKDINLLRFNVVPLIGVFKSNTLKFDTEPIKRSVKTISTDINLGYLFGTTYQLRGYSYSKDYKELEKLYDSEYLASVSRLLSQEDIALTEFNLKYLAKESKAKSTTFTLYFDTLYNQKNTGEMGLATPTKHVEANSIARREEIIKKVSSGIDSATVRLFDFSAKIEAQNPVEFVFTGALADSVIDSKLQAAFFANSNLYEAKQFNGVIKMDSEKSKMYSLSFEEALKHELKVTYEGNIQYDEYNLTLKGYGARSKEYSERLMKDPMAKHCLQDIKKQNFYQDNCFRMIVKAYAPDYFKTTITYNDKNRVGYMVDYAYKQYLKDKVTIEQEPNFGLERDEVETKFFYYDSYMTTKWENSLYTYNWEDEENALYYPYTMSAYGPINTVETNVDWFTDYEWPVYCAVDDSRVWTFSGRSYDYAITGSWHVVMVNDANELGKNLVILVRRPSPNHEEVYISYKTEEGKFFELDIKPDNIEVKTNANKLSNGTLTMYWDEDEEKPLLQYYALDDGVYMFDIHENEIRLIYDKHRLIIFTDDYYGNTNGICGQSSTEIYDDYITPFGKVDRPELYGASFSIEGEFNDPKTVDWKKGAKLKAYKPKIRFTNNIDDMFKSK